MGALLSLPLLAVPSAGTIITFMASCCGAATCSAVCSACGKCNNSIATRIAYALILLVNSLVSWLMLTDYAMKKLQDLALNYVKISCNGKACYGVVAVHRFNFALTVFHLVMAILLLGVRSSKDGRAPIQNGFWGPKIIAWIGLVVASFFIPDSFFLFWAKYIALIGACLFLLIGLVLLVDLAHHWAEYCLLKIEDAADENRSTVRSVWQGLLVGSTITMFLGSFAMTIVMYIYFSGGQCHMNNTAITINLLLMLVVSAISVAPQVQEANSRAGLAQSAIVAVYCTYLTLSAIGMEPDDKCNPLIQATGTRRATVVLGAIFTFLAMAYTTTRAATYGVGLRGSAGGNEYQQLSNSDAHSLAEAQQPQSRREMRAEALRAAVESGALPASALDESDDESDDEDNTSSKRKGGRDDERQGTQYNYTSFHIIFLLSTMWVATLLTMTVDEDSLEKGALIAVGRTFWASWVKIVSAWICYGIYSWSLLAPVILPDRFDY